jgi:hypothetical protein
MQRGMAKEAEAERERRAKIVAAEVVIGGNPASHPPKLKKTLMVERKSRHHISEIET